MISEERDVVAMVTAVGAVGYGSAARQTILSLLEHTAFDVVVGCDATTVGLLPASERVHTTLLPPPGPVRADPFLTKFATWRHALERREAQVLLHVDADAVLTRPLDAATLDAALGPSALAMVEQTTITGSTMGRAEFHRHFLDHSLRYLAPDLVAPSVDEFRFHNSGVVAFRALELRNFLWWADAVRARTDGSHSVGEHMIADQDYLQVWVNVLRRGACADLEWAWNHCEWWDDDFPRPEARILHFSNFCNGPPPVTARRMEDARRGPGPAVPSLAVPSVSFLLVTHDSAAVAADCAAVLASFDGVEVIVVDNASDDDTVDRLAGLDVVRNDTNEGFAAAVNRAAALATGEILVLVNPDCFPTREVLVQGLAVLSESPRTVVVPRYVHADGTVVAGRQPGYTAWKLLSDILDAGRVARRRSDWFDARLHDGTWSWPLAALLFVRADVFAELGGLDEAYFCYMEDVEFGRACARAGVAVVEVDVPVVHLGSSGSATSTARRVALLDAARIAYARRHHGAAFAGALRALRAARRLADRVRRP